MSPPHLPLDPPLVGGSSVDCLGGHIGQFLHDRLSALPALSLLVEPGDHKFTYAKQTAQLSIVASH